MSELCQELRAETKCLLIMLHSAGLRKWLLASPYSLIPAPKIPWNIQCPRDSRGWYLIGSGPQE